MVLALPGDVPSLGKAQAAKNRTALLRPEWHGRLNPALGADNVCLGAGRVARPLDTPCAFRLACLATPWIILELPLSKEELFGGREHKFLVAVRAFQDAIHKLLFHRSLDFRR